MFLIANVISLVSCLGAGIISDHYKIYKIQIIINIIVLGSLSMMLSDIYYSREGNIGWLYYIGFTLAQGFHINTFALSTITLAKLCGENTRG